MSNKALSPQMFALLDAIVTGVDYEAFEPFPPRHTVDALIRRDLLALKRIERDPERRSHADLMASIGCVALVPTEVGRKVIADAEAGRASA